jgi:hypothetical protein
LNRINDAAQGLTECGQAIFHTRRDFGIDRALHQSIAFQIA